MAERVELERKEQQSNWWIWLVVGIVALALIWWLLAAQRGPQTGQEEEVAGPLPVAQILGSPQQFHGQEVHGVATVSEVVSPDAFWLEQGGERIFAVWDRGMLGGGNDVVQGQQISLAGTVEPAARLQDHQNLIVDRGTTDPAHTTAPGPGAMGTGVQPGDPAYQGDPAAQPGMAGDPAATGTPGMTGDPAVTGAPGTTPGTAATPGATGTGTMMHDQRFAQVQTQVQNQGAFIRVQDVEIQEGHAGTGTGAGY
jgi:hypothetical protein